MYTVGKIIEKNCLAKMKKKKIFAVYSHETLLSSLNPGESQHVINIARISMHRSSTSIFLYLTSSKSGLLKLFPAPAVLLLQTSWIIVKIARYPFLFAPIVQHIPMQTNAHIVTFKTEWMTT